MAENSIMEKYSSAYTLSDMEIFVFPDLLYALVLANIMSPIIWEWKKDPWFANMEKKSPIQRINRLKQYIMDNFVFNLDLDTWGLTTKQKEIERFLGIVDEETLRKSNALFGYEGDKYYFSIDIRKHFGLDKYEGNVIPYWKTETVEAMNAFRHKKEYQNVDGTEYNPETPQNGEAEDHAVGRFKVVEAHGDENHDDDGGGRNRALPRGPVS